MHVKPLQPLHCAFVSPMSSYTHLYKFKSPLFLSTPLCFSEQIIDQSWIFVGFLLIYAFYFSIVIVRIGKKTVVAFFPYPMANVTDSLENLSLIGFVIWEKLKWSL